MPAYNKPCIHSHLQNISKCQDRVSIVYHGVNPEDEVTMLVNSESVFISPHGRVTVNLLTCFSLNVNNTPDLGVAIRYELAGNSVITRQLLCNIKFQLVGRLHMFT